MIFTFLPEFKKLFKKYKSLNEDFEDLKKALDFSPKWDLLWKDTVKNISWIWEKINWIEFYKVKKFRCSSISKNSKNGWLRIIYSYEENNWKIKFQKIEFIEIYNKSSKTNHDINRIKKNIF